MYDLTSKCTEILTISGKDIYYQYWHGHKYPRRKQKRSPESVPVPKGTRRFRAKPGFPTDLLCDWSKVMSLSATALPRLNEKFYLSRYCAFLMSSASLVACKPCIATYLEVSLLILWLLKPCHVCKSLRLALPILQLSKEAQEG